VILIITIVATLGLTFWWIAAARLAESEARAESGSARLLRRPQAARSPARTAHAIQHAGQSARADRGRSERAQVMLDRLIGSCAPR